MGTTEETKPWPRYHVFVSAEMERTEWLHVKKLDAFPMLLVVFSYIVLRVLIAAQKALTYLQNTNQTAFPGI